MKIDIGGGMNPKEGFLCVDRCDSADYMVDLEYSNLPFEDESVDEVYTAHTFEHIENIIHLMNEIWRVMKWGARIEIIVPHHECTLAFQDPTHKRFFNAQSMKFFQGIYVNKYKLNYGIICAFMETENTTTLKDVEVKGGADLPYFVEQKFVLEKNEVYYEENKPFYMSEEFQKPEAKGTLIDETKVYEMFDEELDKAYNLFIKKNKDYGNAYFSGKQDLNLIFSNFTRKYMRLDGFYKHGNEYLLADETTEDTLRDLAIYSIMEIVRLRGENKK